jgi:hypothetical protein
MTGEAELIWEAELGSWSHARKAELERAYRALDDEIAPVLARRVVEVVERREAKPARAVELLAHLTCFVPDALAGLHGRMLDADVLSSFFYPHVLQHGIMFRSADPEARDRLSMLAVQSPSRALGDHALKSLAWVDDDEVPRLCSRFDEHPPPRISGGRDLPNPAGVRQVLGPADGAPGAGPA